jgi:hypothetical protein
VHSDTLATLIFSVNETEQTLDPAPAALKNVHRYGIAGSPTVSRYPQDTEVMLLNAVKAYWDETGGTPRAADIRFSNTWFSDSRDYEITFLFNSMAKPAALGWRTTDWSRQQVEETIDAHLWVRGNGGDVKPAGVGKLRDRLEEVIELHSNDLIPYAHATVTRTITALEPVPDDLQTVWHILTTISVVYWKMLA